MPGFVFTVAPFAIPGAFSSGATLINDSGQMAGSFAILNDSTLYGHGFIQTGSLVTTIDVPGAFSTTIYGLNANGDVAGSYRTSLNGAEHGFVDIAGTITTFDPGGFSYPTGITDAGLAYGSFPSPFVFAAGTLTGYTQPGLTLRSLVALDAAGNSTGVFETTQPLAHSTVTTTHVFINRGGTLTTLDPTGGASDITVLGMSVGGTIVGEQFFGTSASPYYFSNASGFVTFSVPGALDTIPEAISPAGEIVGWYHAGDGHLAAFALDSATGTFGTFDVAGAVFPRGMAVNAAGRIVGAYGDALGNGHGFTVACFAAGTPIRTDRGDIPVEALRPGDRVRSVFGGSVPVVWTGHRHIRPHRHPAPERVNPILISAGALGPSVPATDLWLSPDHGVYLDGRLVPAGLLVNGRSILQLPVRDITYWHVELAQHDVILAAGAPCETYLDTGNRADFDGAPITTLHPDFAGANDAWQALACAPQCRGGPALAAIRAALPAAAPSAIPWRQHLFAGAEKHALG